MFESFQKKQSMVKQWARGTIIHNDDDDDDEKNEWMTCLNMKRITHFSNPFIILLICFTNKQTKKINFFLNLNFKLIKINNIFFLNQFFQNTHGSNLLKDQFPFDWYQWEKSYLKWVVVCGGLLEIYSCVFDIQVCVCVIRGHWTN